MVAPSSQTVSLAWNPNPDTNVAGYALYIGNTSGNYTSRIDVGSNCTNNLSGLSNGVTFYFVVTDYDSEDVESAPSNEAEFVAPTNSTVTLNAITNYSIPVLTNLVITNIATDTIRTNKLTFTLAAGAPTNMVIDSSNGVLEWMPPLTYAGTTNSVTVIAADNGVPPNSAMQTFTITVSNYVQMGFGASVVALGNTNNVPLILNSSAGVTNLTFILTVPGNRMTNLSVTSLMPSIATVTQRVSGSANTTVTVQAVAGQVLQGSLAVAQLNYKAVTNLPSCFAPLHATNITAVQSNGITVPTTFNGLGEAVLVGSQALMQSCTMSNGQRNVIVYGPAGTNYQVQSRIGLTGTWTNELSAALMPTNLWVTFSNVPPATSQKYYRAHAM